ncbi:MAG: hypothetical protein CMH54_05900 [Myxococcales bacterium]|nr:hypothetical protein [Myxococcales bacterium]
MNLHAARRTLRTVLLGLLFLGLLPTTAQANSNDLDFGIDGRLRYRHSGLTDFPLDTDGFLHGQTSRGQALLRISPYLNYGENFGLKLTLQVLDGQLYGAPSDAAQQTIGGDQVLNPFVDTPYGDQLFLREAFLRYRFAFGELRFGRMLSHWGLGMVANGGDKEQYAFSDASVGDISNRVMFLTRPLAPMGGSIGKHLVLVLAGDLVEQDDLVDRKDGDKAIQAIGALAWNGDNLNAGVYVAHRRIDDHADDKTRATAVDVFAAWKHDVCPNLGFDFAFEAAMIRGETELARFEGAEYPIQLEQYGAVLRTGMTHRPIHTRLQLEAGFASGDNHTRDSTARAFKFDPGYKVGMILFEEILHRVSARTYDHATDPNLMGEPHKGVNLLPSNGSVTNTVYVHPTLTYGADQPGIDASVGFLFAYAPADLVDAYQSGLVGGYNQSAYGKRNANGVLGYEANIGLGYTLNLGKELSMRVGGQYGFFKPGDALAAAEGVEGLGNVQKWRLLADLNW